MKEIKDSEGRFILLKSFHVLEADYNYNFQGGAVGVDSDSCRSSFHVASVGVEKEGSLVRKIVFVGPSWPNINTGSKVSFYISCWTPKADGVNSGYDKRELGSEENAIRIECGCSIFHGAEDYDFEN